MKRFIILYCLLFLLIFPVLTQEISDQDFLDFLSYDQVFYPYFKAELTFEVHNINQETDESRLKLYVNDEKSLVKFEEPKTEKGKIILQIDNKYWIYFPRTKRSSALSPLTSLAGNASNSDVLREPDAEFYNIFLDGETPNGERIAVFEAKSRKAPYGKIIAHYDGYKKIYSEIYSRNGILIKKAEYSQHLAGSQSNIYLPLYTKITDGKNPDKYTIMQFDNVEEQKSINESWFKPNNLGRVR